MAINSIRLPYIAEQISKKDGFVVMFPDKTGDVYVLADVPMELQKSVTRKAYFERLGIKPSVQFTVADDGILEIFGTAKNPKTLEKAQMLLESKFGLNYLLAHGYVTREHALGMVAGAVLAKSAGEISIDQAVATASAIYENVKAKNEKEINAWLGVSSSQLKKIAASQDQTVSPETIAPETIQTIEIKSEEVVTTNAVTTEPRNSRNTKK